MWGSKAFLSTELPLVSRIWSKAAKAAEEKFDLILFQSLMVSMDTRWTSSLAAVVEFITAGPSQSRPSQSRVESRRHGHGEVCHTSELALTRVHLIRSYAGTRDKNEEANPTLGEDVLAFSLFST